MTAGDLADGHLQRLTAALEDLRAAACAAEVEFTEEIERLDHEGRGSARNLVHYLAVRRNDLRSLQDELAATGLSSLGRMEAHVLPTLDAVLRALRRMQGDAGDGAGGLGDGFAAGSARLAEHAARLLGEAPADRATRIMVTMPSEAAQDPQLVRDLLEAGMDVMRINCAHDDADAWRAMAAHLREARALTGRPCRILVDLAGPKLRTGAMRAVARNLRIRPRRDGEGRVIEPARLWVTNAAAPAPVPPDLEHRLPVRTDGPLLTSPGDRIMLRDARGLRRRLLVVASDGEGCEVHCHKGLRLAAGLRATLERSDGHRQALEVCSLGGAPEAALLETGDRLVLTADPAPGRDALRDASGAIVDPAVLPCTLPEVLPALRPGDRVLFDDGRIEGVADRVKDRAVEVRITRARTGGARLGADKGINLPDTAIDLPPLTDQDLRNLDVIVDFADLVGMSFLRRPEDVRRLRAELAARDAAGLGVMLKIETRDAFEDLPRILLAGLGPSPLGVMVARGDLAVEIGFERLAEVQEEILWFAEAAHAPVVWATQVLDTLARKGAPSRAEVTDAAMGGRAECVMLNKGPHAVDAVRFLDDVLARMQAHQHKKSAMLRALHVSR